MKFGEKQIGYGVRVKDNTCGNNAKKYFTQSIPRYSSKVPHQQTNMKNNEIKLILLLISFKTPHSYYPQYLDNFINMIIAGSIFNHNCGKVFC